MLEIGSIIDSKYRILSCIGKGGMSEVYLAINDKANKPWAIKEVRKDVTSNFEILKQSLVVEIDLLKKLKHPNLPSIVDVIDRDDNFLIVMDYIEGVTLKSVLDDLGAQDQENVVDWALQLCDVLCYLHSREPAIIYRDMKPSNIMLKSDGNVVLIDFGTAREYKEQSVEDTACLGTQGYAAPEQFGGYGQTDCRTDIYNLGATIYHLVTGHNPSEPPYEMYPITTWNQSLSTGLEKIILKCTQKNPCDRFQTAQELKEALEHYKELDQPIIKKYKRQLAVFGLTCILSLACGVGAIWLQTKAAIIKREQYSDIMMIADHMDTKEEGIQRFLDAIASDCVKKDAYISLIDAMTQDGVFDKEEAAVISNLFIDVNDYCGQFRKKNPEGYADFCYQVGNAYWYYYSQQEAQKTNAVIWFEDASEIYAKKTNRKMEKKRCDIYIELGNFNKKVSQARIEGKDAGMYASYWNNMVALIEANRETPDTPVVTLKMYEEVIAKTMDYAQYFKQDQITIDEIQKVFLEISADVDFIEKEYGTQGVMVTEMIEKIRQLLVNSEEIIRSTF